MFHYKQTLHCDGTNDEEAHAAVMVTSFHVESVVIPIQCRTSSELGLLFGAS